MNAVVRAHVDQEADRYGTIFSHKLKHDGRHIPRVFQFAFQRCMKCLFGTRSVAAPLTVSVPPSLRPPPYSYAGFRGPWFEEVFANLWQRYPNSTGACYCPIYWNYLYQHIQGTKYLPREYRALMAQMEQAKEWIASTNAAFFTITDYDHALWEWHRFPRNMIVFNGGDGDIPIPLLKGPMPLTNHPKDLLVSFMGRLDGASDRNGVRSRMYAALKDFAYFGYGADWRRVTGRSLFTLCPRGLGRGSFRMYEALSMKSIPIYIWDDREWLPFTDEIDWNNILLSVNIAEIDTVPDRVRALTSEEIAFRQHRISQIYNDFLTASGVFRQIVKRMANVHTAADALRYTAMRIV